MKKNIVGSVTVDLDTAYITCTYELKSYTSAPQQLGYNWGTISSSTYKFTVPDTFDGSEI
jgi:hypothetical protein